MLITTSLLPASILVEPYILADPLSSFFFMNDLLKGHNSVPVYSKAG